MQPTAPRSPCSTLTRRTALLLGTTLLSACAGKDWVGMARQSSFSPPPPNNPEPLLKGSEAVAQALARGGYIIYMRHGRTQYDQLELERAHRNSGTFDLARCETQRQLSDEGRNELRQSGQQFRLAQLPIDRIYSSRYCRAVESATFFVDGAQPTDMLSGEGEVGIDPAQKARTVGFFSQRPVSGKNTYMMAHGGIFWEATGFVIQEAHTVVLDPSNLKVIIARITPQEWGGIAQARSK